MGMKKILYVALLILFLCATSPDSVVQGRLISSSIPTIPDHHDAVATARWLISLNFWGVLNTISSDLGGAPFGNVISFSDGLPNKGTGIPYFYMSLFNPTVQNALKDERASFTVSEYPLGTCGKKDPEDPTCSKITLTGKLKLVDEKSKEAEFARNALFSKHPEMKGWPADHKFEVFKLEIENIFLISWYGGARPITVEQYLQPKMNNLHFVI